MEYAHVYCAYGPLKASWATMVSFSKDSELTENVSIELTHYSTYLAGPSTLRVKLGLECGSQ